MRVTGGAAVPGEMLDGAPDPNRVLRLDEGGRLLGHDRWVGGEAAPQRADDRVVGVDVQVHDRCKVEVDPHRAEGVAHGSRLLSGVHGIVAKSHLLLGNGGRKAVALVKAGNQAALLVDGRDQRNRSGRLQTGDQGPQLLGGLHIPHRGPGRGVVVEQDHASQGVVADVGDDRARFLKGQPAEADQQHLPDLVAEARPGARGRARRRRRRRRGRWRRDQRGRG